jgi:hypothetical protein
MGWTRMSEILGATNPAQLQAQEPAGFWERATFGSGAIDRAELMRQAKIKELQATGAAPAIQQLADYNNQGWSSDPSFTGKEWTEGLLTTPAFNAPGATAPDMKNPNVLAAVTGFAEQAQKEKGYSDQLQRLGATPQEAGSVAQFAMDPKNTPHLKTLQDLPTAFIPSLAKPTTADAAAEQDTRDQQFLANAYSPIMTGQDTQAGAMNVLGEIGNEYKPSPAVFAKASTDLLSKMFTDKATPAPNVRPVQQGNGMLQDMQYDPASPLPNKYVIPIGPAYKPAAQQRIDISGAGGRGGTLGININGLSTEENDALSRAIDNGLDPYKINSKTAKIYASQEMLKPGRKWNELGATASFERNAGVMNTKALLNAIDPILTGLENAGAALGNSRIPGANRIINWAKEQTGNVDIVAFNNLRDDAVAEVERGLLGSGVLSDSKYNRAIKNINSAQTLPQLKAAIKNTKFVIAARLEALAAGPSAKPAETGKPAAEAKPQIAPAGTKAKLTDGRLVTSDGKGGWK